MDSTSGKLRTSPPFHFVHDQVRSLPAVETIFSVALDASKRGGEIGEAERISFLQELSAARNKAGGSGKHQELALVGGKRMLQPAIDHEAAFRQFDSRREQLREFHRAVELPRLIQSGHSPRHAGGFVAEDARLSEPVCTVKIFRRPGAPGSGAPEINDRRRTVRLSDEEKTIPSDIAGFRIH